MSGPPDDYKIDNETANYIINDILTGVNIPNDYDCENARLNEIDIKDIENIENIKKFVTKNCWKATENNTGIEIKEYKDIVKLIEILDSYFKHLCEICKKKKKLSDYNEKKCKEYKCEDVNEMIKKMNLFDEKLKKNQRPAGKL